MGRSRRQTHRTTPTAGIGGLRRAAAQHPSSPPPTEEVGSDSPDRGSRHLASSRPQALGGPESFSGIETAHLGSGHSRQYSGASRAGMALAHSATPPPPPTPKSPSPDPGAILQGDTGGMDTPRGRQTGAGSIPAPLGDHPTSDGTHTRPRPLVPGHVGPAPTQQLNRTKLETLHKHLETRLKIMAHHPKDIKNTRPQTD
jgi:hypothetical protein